MSLFRPLRRILDVRISAADNAVKQYNKARSRNIPDKDIPKLLFMTRYSAATLTDEDKERLSDYFDSDFEFDSLVDFVLATLDIEIDFSPYNSETYLYTAQLIQKEIAKQKIQINESDYKTFVAKWALFINPKRQK